MIYRMIAFLKGYREARDVEDGRLVVFGNGVHFYSWKDTARHG